MCFSVVGCGGGVWWCINRLSAARHMLDTPTSKIRSAAQGYVEFYGVLQEVPTVAQTLAPLTGTPCLWWRIKVEESRSNGKSRTWSTVDSRTSEGWLQLSDSTGECLIDPSGAQVRPSTRKVWYGNTRHPMGPAKSGFFALLLNQENGYRYTEERLHVGQPLYAIGDFKTTGGGRQGLDVNAAQGEVIREWKGDFDGLMQRFDSNGDGQLDEREWNRVRLAAQLEAEDRHRQTSARPATNFMGQPQTSQPFILSNAGEDELARAFYWQAAAGAVVCLLGALAINWVLQNYHG
ncbi:GIDE domain-containing protein [Pseudomonas sp. TE3786]